MLVRYSKFLFVCAIALFASLVAFGNITDYGTNFLFVQHVLLMDTLFPGSSITYRAIHSPVLHHLGYGLIIFLEALTALLCWWGAYRLFKAIKAPARGFNQSKSMASAGLALGFLVWQIVFMSIGGEWFGMWMSKEWNGTSSAFRISTTLLLVLIYLNQKDEDPEDGVQGR